MYGSSWRLEPDAVPGAVDERVAVAAGRDHVARRRVDRLRASPRVGRARRRPAGRRAAPGSSRRTRPAARRRCTSACSRSSSPRAVVPPMSTTTGSPRSMTRSETSWCGQAPFGPEPTMTKSTLTWPSSRIASAMSRPDLALGAPGSQPLRHPGVHAVDRLTGAAQRVDLVGRLAHPQLAEHLREQGLLGAGQRGPQPQHLLGPHLVVQRHPTGAGQPGGDQGVRVVGLAPAHAPRRRALRPGDASTAGTSSRGATRNGVARRPAGPGRSAARAAARRSRSASAGPGRASRAGRRGRPQRRPSAHVTPGREK